MKRAIKILLTSLAVFLLIYLLFFLSDIFLSCTLIGCASTLTLVLPEAIPSDNLVVIIDDYEIVDNCNGKAYQNVPQRYENRVYLPSHHPVSGELIEKIDYLEIGYRETCEDDAKIIYSYSDLSIEYRIAQPNGPRCEPTCYNSIVNLE